MTDAPTTRETADHTELARLAEAASPGPWAADTTSAIKCASVRRTSGARTRTGYAAILRMKTTLTSTRAPQALADAAFIAAANPATVLGLLSEIAALKGERDDLERHRDRLAITCQRRLDDWRDAQAKTTQVERQRDELRKALEPFAVAAANFDENDTCDAEPDDYVFTDFNCLSVGHLRSARRALANQGADQ